MISNNKLRCIGDVHGLYTQYHNLISNNPNTIQVGDMGVGFLRWPHGEKRQNPYHDLMVAQNALFIRGNHDNPEFCFRHPRCIRDGHVVGTKNGNIIMFVGGAHSIDREFRIEGFSWWEREQLTQAQMNEIMDVYVVAKPNIMVTHDTAIVAVNAMHSHHMFDNSRTQQLFQAMWELHKPHLWIYGHHHMSFEKVIEGTRFVCLNELEIREFDV